MAVYDEIYFSVDIEADGPNPGDYSMLSLAAVACATRSKNDFQRLNMDNPNLGVYFEFKPISIKFEEGAVEVCKQGGVDREVLKMYGADPVNAIPALEEEIRAIAGNRRPVFVAYPLSFDWMWYYWYACKYGSGMHNPFGFSGCLDIKSMYAAKADALVINSTKRNMPKVLKSYRPHTHNAMDDAKEQGDLFCNLMEWNK